MRLVILESPYAGEVADNVAYAKLAMLDCLRRNEAPMVSHLLYTLVLDDTVPVDRATGILAGLAWLKKADAMVVYTDRGVSPGMAAAMNLAEQYNIPIEYRRLASL